MFNRSRAITDWAGEDGEIMAWRRRCKRVKVHGDLYRHISPYIEIHKDTSYPQTNPTHIQNLHTYALPKHSLHTDYTNICRLHTHLPNTHIQITNTQTTQTTHIHTHTQPTLPTPDSPVNRTDSYTFNNYIYYTYNLHT